MDSLVIDKFSGGLSLGSRLGIDGSFYYGKGLSYTADPDGLTNERALAKDSNATVDSLVKWIVNYGTDTYHYAANGDLYKRIANGTWSLARAVATSKGQGMAIYDDYLYYRTNGDVGRYGDLSGSPTFNDDWATDVQSATINTLDQWGAIQPFLDVLCIANGEHLAIYDSGDDTLDDDRISFPPNYYVRDLGVMGQYLAIAVNDAEDLDESTRGFIFFWDGTSTTYNFFVETIEPVSAIQANQDSVYIFTGSSGNVYLYTGSLNKIKRVPFMPRGEKIYVNPSSTTNFEGLVHFGLADGDSGSVYRGIYTWGQPELNYSKSLNMPFPISTGTLQEVDLNIGAVKAIGSDLWIAWDDDGSYGVDLLSSNFQTQAIYESRIFSMPTEASFVRYKLYFESLAADESIEIKYKADYAGSWTSIGTASTDGDTFKLFSSPEVRATDMQFRIELNGTTSAVPTLTKFVAQFERTQKL